MFIHLYPYNFGFVCKGIATHAKEVTVLYLCTQKNRFFCKYISNCGIFELQPK